MKKIITILLVIISVSCYAQTGMLMNRFYITGSLALGKGDRTFADTSAWLQLGKDTTKKGIVLPRVVLDSIKTSKRGLFVYDLKDSVLYHFDSNKRVRYMTYRDTVLIKQLIANNVPIIDTHTIATKYYVNSSGFIKDGGNTTGNAISIGTNDNQALNIETNNTSRITVATDGSVGVGLSPVTGTDKLQVAGSLLSHGIRFNNVTNPNANTFNLIRRFNDGAKDGVEIIAGGANGGYSGGFRIKTRGANATQTPIESFIIHGDIITMGYHLQDVNGNGSSSLFSQVNMIRNNTDGQLLNLWNRSAGHPVIQTFSNYSYGSGGPTITSSIVCESYNATYRGILSFFTNNGNWGDFSSNTRAMFIDGNQNVAVGLSRNLAPTQDATGIILPSAKLHILGNVTTTPVSIFQTTSGQTADITQWRNETSSVISKIDKDGNAEFQKLKTAQPSANGAGEFKFGKVITGTTVTLQTDKFLEIEIDGTIYKLAIVQ